MRATLSTVLFCFCYTAALCVRSKVLEARARADHVGSQHSVAQRRTEQTRAMSITAASILQPASLDATATEVDEELAQEDETGDAAADPALSPLQQIMFSLLSAQA